MRRAVAVKESFEVALATCVNLPEPDPDAAPLSQALESAGVRAGIPVPPTELVARGSECALAALLDHNGWDEVVVKPAISAASWRTLRSHRDDLGAAQTHLHTLLQEGDVLIQRYLNSVEDYGERAIVLIDGEVTHAIRKSPRFSGGAGTRGPGAFPLVETAPVRSRRRGPRAGRTTGRDGTGTGGTIALL
jgi:hypothetical protein